MKPLNSKQINNQLQVITQHVDLALDWLESTRQHSPRLDIEADSLRVKLHRCRYQAVSMQELPQHFPSIGFFGLSQAGKSYLISALAAGESGQLVLNLAGRTLDFDSHINPGNQACGVVTRFTHRAGINNHDFPIEIAILAEYELAKAMVDAFIHDFSFDEADQERDEEFIADHLSALSALCLPEPVAGFSEDDAVALWDAVNRRIGARGKTLDLYFWPSAVRLAPYLSVDNRARLFSLLWSEQEELTAAYVGLGHILQRLSSVERVAAPLSVLVDDMQLPTEGLLSVDVLSNANSPLDFSVQVCPQVKGKTMKPVELSISELSMLAREITLPLAGTPREAQFQQMDVLDIPGLGQSLESEFEPSCSLLHVLQQAKVYGLLERYADNQQIAALMVCTAATARSQTHNAGKVLAHWAKAMRSDAEHRKPTLIWALTAFDQRVTQGKNYDEAVQRHVGLPGDSWGSMLVTDKSGVRRMVDYLATEANSDATLRQLAMKLEALRRELAENLLGNWLLLSEQQEEQEKQRIAQILLKTLQTRTGVHGELLERLLPTRDELRRLYLQQRLQQRFVAESAAQSGDNTLPIMNGDPFGIEMNIDLVADVVSETSAIEQQALPEGNFATQAYQYWVNHLRNLSENGALLTLLGVAKPELELLLQELITASVRMEIPRSLSQTLFNTELAGVDNQMLADRQVSRVLGVLGNFVAWLGFQNVAEAKKPDSRVNRGQKIFAKPPAMNAASWGKSQRLTKLSAAPSNNTGFYIYDWLVGLSEMIIQNQGYSAARELSQQQEMQLRRIVESLAA